jgi:AraC-like DNA-binding protein
MDVRSHMDKTVTLMHLHTLRVEHHRFQGPLRQPRKRSPWHVIHVLHEGSVRLSLGRRVYELRAPCCWVTTPKGPGFSYLFGEGASRKWYIGADGPALAPWEARGHFPREPFALTDLHAVQTRIQSLDDAARMTGSHAGRRRALLYEELLLLLSEQRGAPVVDDEDWPLALLERMNDESARPPEADALAHRLGCSAAPVRRRFLKATGRSLIAAWNEARTALAARLLCEADIPVAEIARRVGYDDPLYFSRVFKQQFGLAPREFRNEIGDGG